jgi:hypothetical protein
VANTTSGTTTFDKTFAIDEIIEEAYERIGLQSVSGNQLRQARRSLTSQYFVQRFIDKVTITLYLTPGSTEAGNFINYYYVKRIQDVGDYTNATDVPYRFVPCMASGLAYYLSQKFKPELTQQMKLLYEDELQRALAEDGSSSSSYITPKTYYPNV